MCARRPKIPQLSSLPLCVVRWLRLCFTHLGPLPRESVIPPRAENETNDPLGQFPYRFCLPLPAAPSRSLLLARRDGSSPRRSAADSALRQGRKLIRRAAEYGLNAGAPLHQQRARRTERDLVRRQHARPRDKWPRFASKDLMRGEMICSNSTRTGKVL